MQQKYRIPQPVPMMQRLAQLSQFRGHRKEHYATTTTTGDPITAAAAAAATMEGTQQQSREEDTRTDVMISSMLCYGWMRLYMIQLCHLVCSSTQSGRCEEDAGPQLQSSGATLIQSLIYLSSRHHLHSYLSTYLSIYASNLLHQRL